ncbi:glycoside hydrolase family 16 protein [Gillisia sp. Hel_I_86]|uniref:glycoside hydrolase family 16 protein n=1 Tax=Gillisia sp. Hel_I_86 TaxID=1249981 RepID=UPI0021BD40C1|nr:glycoside hydrolase family 16 protein [Gillisia sp. Hel_I_86]
MILQGKDSSNPNGDGSGKLILNFSAENANSYKINFGNGETVQTSNQTYTYTYTGSGTTTYEVYVSAYNAEKFISQTNSILVYVAPGLIWADEFNEDGGPKNSNWAYDTGAGGWGNNEAEYYTTRTDNVIVENGFLKIIAKKEDYEGANYTSARLKTQGKFDFKYGKVEVRAKLPSGGGTWPAIWMLGSNITTVGWPACGEIDIMEHVGNNVGRVSSAIHTPSSFGNTQNVGATNVSSVTSEFHVYGVEWTAQKIAFSIDGNVFYTYSPSVKNAQTWPFDKEQFIILNVAMGGNLGGDIDPEFTEGIMEIDYVRVYN